MAKTIVNKQLALQGRDGWKAALIGLGTAVLSGLWELYQANGQLEGITWEAVIQAAVAAALMYLGKNFFETSKKVTVEKLPKK